MARVCGLDQVANAWLILAMLSSTSSLLSIPIVIASTRLLPRLKIAPEKFTKFDYHIHVPAGAIPKDGPSAGIAMFTSLVSLLLNKPIHPEVAMTGEITLRGLILPIGGLKEKILAAKQAGIKTVILPARNKKDVPEIPKEAKKGLTFTYVKTTTEALKSALNTE